MRKRGRPPYPDILTPREWEVLALLREGLTNEQIADRLGITIHAARYHVSEILSKLGVSSRQEAAAWEPEKAKPLWAGAVALALWPAKHLPFGVAARGAAAVAAIGATGGIGFLVWGLVVTSSGEASPCDLKDRWLTEQLSETRWPEPFPVPEEVRLDPDDGYIISGRADGCDYCEAERSPTGDERLWVLMRSPECQPVGLVVPGDAGPLDVEALPTTGPDEPSPKRTPIVPTATPALVFAKPVGCPEPYRSTGTAGLGPSGESVNGGWTARYGNLSFYLPEDGQFIIGAGLSDPGGEFWRIYDVQTSSSLFLHPDGCESGRVVGDPAADAVFDAIMASVEVATPAGATPTAAASPYPTPPLTAGPEPTETLSTVTPEATPAPPEHLLGVFVVTADGSGAPVKVAEDGFVEGWSPDGTMIAVSTLDSDQSGCGVAPKACFRELSLARADGQGEALNLGDAQSAIWSARENKLLFYRFARPKGTVVATEIDVADVMTGQTTTIASVGPELSGGPRWSPDESRILFGFGSGLYVVPSDGSHEPVRVADGNILESDWSPDGTTIVYSWGGEIYTAAADGSGEPRHLLTGHRPDWSPDGSRIVFVARSLPTTELRLLDPVTGETEKLYDIGLPVEYPTLVWAPDGSLLLYNGSGAIYSLARGGAPPEELANGWFPVWSPDGKRLTFTRGFDREDGAPVKSQLFVSNADGSGLTLVADNLTRNCVTYAWSPDSKRIAFSSFYCPLS